MVTDPLPERFWFGKRPYSSDETAIKDYPKVAKELKIDDTLKSPKEKQINAEIAGSIVLKSVEIQAEMRYNGKNG